ncbi:MAG TPA: hypothetical protein VNJ08_06925 [Bacteriovoracaceae bacterium]|nr:hypothetical protein [Bacteriovoracaceae bacterium]
MKSKFLFAVVFSLMTLNFATAAEQEKLAVEESTELESINHAEFLGCVSTRYECAHEAQHHGYHHSRTRLDHHTCDDHHHPYACYGIQ